MHRSASWNRVGDDFFMHSSTNPATEDKQLNAYDPIAEMARKEKSRIKFAENAVHVIPFVLLLCGFILWLFSNPDVEVGIKADSIAARIEGLTIEGDIDTDSDGTQTGFLPLDTVELEPIKQTGDDKKFQKIG